MAESKNCACGLSFEKYGYCKDGHNDSRCQVDDCHFLLVYGFCYTHSGKALGLEKCPECVCCLIHGKCKNSHDIWRKEQASGISSNDQVTRDDGEFDEWREAFQALAFSKMMD